LRWEYDGFPSDSLGNLTDINPALMSTVATPTGPMTSGAGLVGYIVPANYTTTGRSAPPDGVQTVSGNQTFGQPPLNNFAPRFGFAWQPTNSANLVVRGGFGVFYDRIGMDGMIHGVEQGPPYSATLDYGPGSGHTLENPFSSSFSLGQFPSRWLNLTCNPDGTNCAGGYSALSAPFIPQKIHTPLLRQYNLNIQYEFASNWILEAGYVGSSGINLFDQYHDINVAQLASPSNPINGQTANTIANIPLRVPILGYQSGGLQVSSFDGISNYNSLQLTLKHQFSHGLQMQAAYTWSKSLTDLQPNTQQPGEFAGNVNNPDDLSAQYGRSSFNNPQRFVVNYNYQLPFSNYTGALGKLANGWSVAGVTIVQDGVPLTMFDSNGGTIYGLGTSTAELCPGVTASQMLSHGSLQQRAATGYFNMAAFCAEPTIGDGSGFGNSPIGGVLGPGQFNFDISINKDIKLTEKQSMVFRTEFYNAFNHTQFANPATTIQSGGLITATSVNPRLIQFGLKFLF
jgi:hypothetical protein